MCNRCKITAQLLRNRFIIAAKLLCIRCAIVLLSLCNRCKIAAQLMRNRFTIAEQLPPYRRATAVQSS
jgi:hypothetical protein